MIRPPPVGHLRCLACALFAMLSLLPASAAETARIASQLDFSADTTPATRKFYFETIPGRRYTLQRSTDLQNWRVISGYPQTAAGLAIEHTFLQAANEFFRIEPIDDQAPVIVDQFPGEGAYAVRRFDDLRFILSDATGIDPASIRLTLGNGSALSIGAPGLTFANSVLTYDSGDAALGDYGATVPITLTMADTLGHSITHTFSFTLEVLPKVVSNLFVFGSPAAQRAGQKLPSCAASEVARSQSGPLPMSGGDEWQMQGVLADRVTIVYTGDSAPAFNAGSYLANKTPAKVTEIFYRKILSVSDIPSTKELTLMTQDVPFAEIAEEGSISLSSESYIYDVDASGTIHRALSLNKSITFEPFGVDRDGAGPFPLAPDSAFSLTLPEAHILFTPTLDISLETKWFSLRRASIQSRVDVAAALVPKITYHPTGVTETATISLHTPLRQVVGVGSLGPVPVWVNLTYSTDLKLEASGNAEISLQTGWRRDFSFAAGALYEKGATPALTWSKSAYDSGNLWQPLVLSASGQVTARVAIVPSLDVQIESLAGFYVNIDPGYETTVSATGSLTFTPGTGEIQMDPAYEATLTQGFSANLNAGFSVIGMDQSSLPAFDPYPLFHAPATTYSLKQQVEPLAFMAPVGTQTVTVAIGNAFTLEGEARGGTGPISYQWQQNGHLLAGQTGRRLNVTQFSNGASGTYVLKAMAGGQTASSPSFNVTAVTGDPLAFISPATPVNRTYQEGETMELTAVAGGGVGSVIYQWFFNGNPIPTGVSFRLMRQATTANAGLYWARAQAGSEVKVSPIFNITVIPVGSATEGFALIPADWFQMGDSFGEGWVWDVPVHSVYVSRFYMAKYEVTKALWDEVRAWGASNDHGYTDLAAGGGKAANHPVHSITWYDMVKWCNARSEKEGLTPCYRVAGAVYRTTWNDAVVCDWSASGYRLPSEAEWEKAARGGLRGKRFPWGDTITHGQANYYSNSFTYDASSTRGYHPTYKTGGEPYTSPVGSFAANGYGLYDMAGNVWEWCWDFYDVYTAASQVDPRGPATSPYGYRRVIRGDSWRYDAFNTRCAARYHWSPSDASDDYGFRLARGQP